MRTVHFQKRDYDFLLILALVVILDVSTIRALWFPHDKTGEATLRRLRLLRSHGLISRMCFQEVSRTHQPGRVITLYRLTRAGAELLLEHLGVRVRRFLRKDPRVQTILHRRDLGLVLLAAYESARLLDLPEPEAILEQDQVSGVRHDAKLSRAERFILAEDLRNKEDETNRKIAQLQADLKNLQAQGETQKQDVDKQRTLLQDLESRRSSVPKQ